MASNTNSRTTPTGANGNEKPRLTDAEKKQNHILSEQKRRQAIRQGFDRLAVMTPGMEGMGRSEASVLAAATLEMKQQLALKAVIKRKMLADNPTMTSEFFESFYKVHTTVPVPAQPNSPAASTESGGGSKGKGKQKAKDEN